jgi:hypothetical protein
MVKCKTCSTCKETKNITEFFKDSIRPDGYEYHCKICAIAKKDNNDLRKKYGITMNDYHIMFAAQNGKCKVCGTAELESGKFRMNVDHCHKTGKVRGLLCGGCNRAIGQLKDSPELLRKAADYLEESK